MIQDAPLSGSELRADLAHFLTSLAASLPPELEAQALHAAGEAWKGVDCLACARCCRSMSPRFGVADIKRIALNFRLTTAAVKSRWLVQGADGSWMGRGRPCTFLDTITNKCSIYAIRPQDCAGFPHLDATPVAFHLDMHRQNLKYCPATFNMVGALRQRLSEGEEEADVEAQSTDHLFAQK